MTVTITNRELLRNYKDLKERLINGEIEEVVIPQKLGVIVKIVVEKEKTSFEKLLEKISAKPLKNLKRPEEDII